MYVHSIQDSNTLKVAQEIKQVIHQVGYSSSSAKESSGEIVNSGLALMCSVECAGLLNLKTASCVWMADCSFA